MQTKQHGRIYNDDYFVCTYDCENCTLGVEVNGEMACLCECEDCKGEAQS